MPPLITRSHEIGGEVFGYLPWFLAGSVTLAVCGLAAWWLSERRSVLAFLVLSFGSLFGLQLCLSGLHNVDENYSTEKFAEQFLGEDKDFAPEVPFYSVDHFDPSLAFYLGRTLTLVSYRGELAPGIAAEPDRFVPTVEEFRRRWIGLGARLRRDAPRNVRAAAGRAAADAHARDRPAPRDRFPPGRRAAAARQAARQGDGASAALAEQAGAFEVAALDRVEGVEGERADGAGRVVAGVLREGARRRSRTRSARPSSAGTC